MKNILYTIILSFLFSFSVFADWEDVLEILLSDDKEDRASSRERELEERVKALEEKASRPDYCINEYNIKSQPEYINGKWVCSSHGW